VSILLKNEKECIYCGKAIKHHAIRCKYCKRYQSETVSELDKKDKTSWIGKIIQKLKPQGKQ